MEPEMKAALEAVIGAMGALETKLNILRAGTISRFTAVDRRLDMLAGLEDTMAKIINLLQVALTPRTILNGVDFADAVDKVILLGEQALAALKEGK